MTALSGILMGVALLVVWRCVARAVRTDTWYWCPGCGWWWTKVGGRRGWCPEGLPQDQTERRVCAECKKGNL